MVGVCFEAVKPTGQQEKVMYDLLLGRKHVISHKTIPPFSTHVDFVRNNPYRSWYIVKCNDVAVGTFYISKDNTIGINIDDEKHREVVPKIIEYVKSNYDPLPEIKSVRGDIFVINVPRTNNHLTDALDNLGVEILQTSYLIC